MRATWDGRTLLLAIANGAIHRLDSALAERAGMTWGDLAHYARELVENGLAVLLLKSVAGVTDSSAIPASKAGDVKAAVEAFGVAA